MILHCIPNTLIVDVPNDMTVEKLDNIQGEISEYVNTSENMLLVELTKQYPNLKFHFERTVT